jgi:ABC-type phosphate/phosphonate transport system ATPase subunit
MLRTSYRGETGLARAADVSQPVSSVITLAGVSKRFQNTVALHNVSATILPGQFVAIIGRSGAGKTTLLRCLSRTLTVTAGSICFGTCDLA